MLYLTISHDMIYDITIYRDISCESTPDHPETAGKHNFNKTPRPFCRGSPQSTITRPPAPRRTPSWHSMSSRMPRHMQPPASDGGSCSASASFAAGLAKSAGSPNAQGLKRTTIFVPSSSHHFFLCRFFLSPYFRPSRYPLAVTRHLVQC